MAYWNEQRHTKHSHTQSILDLFTVLGRWSRTLHPANPLAIARSKTPSLLANYHVILLLIFNKTVLNTQTCAYFYISMLLKLK